MDSPKARELGTEQLFINGEWVPARSGRTYPIHNPATGELLGYAADADEDDTRRAIDAASEAFATWSRVPAKERGELLRQAARRLRELRPAIARRLTLEQGKPLAEAAGEIEYGTGFLDWFAGQAERVTGDVLAPVSATKRHLVLKQPVGVVGAITPWNFPASMVTRKLAPALAAGCTVVLKPAEQTPFTATAIVRAFQEAGFPPGVVNLVTASDPRVVGEQLLSDERVRKITFTGSTAVGKYLMKRAADQVKRVSLELGGHAPFIVFEDADLDKAVNGILTAKFRNTGQMCVSANRIFLQESIADAFTERLVEVVKRLRVGYGWEEGVQVGPLINQAALEKVRAHVADAVAKGAEVVWGGREPDDPSLANGAFYMPTILRGVREGMLVMEEETFGPVAPLLTFRDEEEVYRRANATRYGLAAYVFTESLARAIRAAESLEFGMVGINEGRSSTNHAPFGGFKESGLGREGGEYGIDEFLELKTVAIDLGN